MSVIVAALLVILVCVLVLVTLARRGRPDWISVPHPSGQHGTSSPGGRFADVVEEFGKPSVVDPAAGGVAIWDRETLAKTPTGWQYPRVEIRDEQVPHGDHADFLYTWMKIPVPEHLVGAVRALSDSVTYDPLKQEARARCHFMGANAATLALAKRIATNEMDPAAAKAAYTSTVQGSKSSAGYAALVRELQEYARSLPG